MLLGIPGESLCSPQSTVGPDPKSVEIDENEVNAHRIGESVFVRAPQEVDLFESMQFRIIVDQAGAIRSVHYESGPTNLATAATAKLRAISYRPFTRDGIPVRASFTERVSVLPPQRPIAHHIKFPEVVDRSSIRISLTRTQCFGTCSAYELTISGDGAVDFDGRAYTLVHGQHRAFIAADAVTALVNQFRAADFLSLDEKYVAQLTDGATYEIAFTADGRKKRVVDYFGSTVGMPESVWHLESEIDRVAGSDRWVEGNAETVRALADEHFDFHSSVASEILQVAAARGETEILQALLTQGSCPSIQGDGRFDALSRAAAGDHLDAVRLLLSVEDLKWSQLSLDHALIYGAYKGDLELMRLLIAHGANPVAVEPDEQEKPDALFAAAESGVPDAVAEILKYHPNLRIAGRNGESIFAASNFAASLSAVSSGAADPRVDRVAVVEMLSRAGADVNARDQDKNTALHLVSDPNLLMALIRAGANVNAQNDAGQTPLMRTFDLDCAKALVAAGADTSIADNQGETIFDVAKQRNWPDVSFLGTPPAAQ